MEVLALLEEHRDKLRRELRAVENTINELKSQVKRLAESAQPNFTAPLDRKDSYKFNRGDGAKMLRLIYTGKTTLTDLFQTAGIEDAKFRQRLSTLTAEGFIVVKNNEIELTPEGQKRAKWFVENPFAKMYHGS